MAAEAQEKIYFNQVWDGTGTPWPLGATIIKVPRNHEIGIDFDNKMTIYIDDKEIIHAYSSLLINDDSRENRVISELGSKNLEVYKKGFLWLLGLAGKNDEVAAYRELWKIHSPESSI
ncbi:MAG: hypothetical protein DYH13_00765 [Alphaproteobacteria bacterium PRO2]|nr:hypothetical protein [Alphaproteobacteria bacterium PRO2]